MESFTLNYKQMQTFHHHSKHKSLISWRMKNNLFTVLQNLRTTYLPFFTMVANNKVQQTEELCECILGMMGFPSGCFLVN